MRTFGIIAIFSLTLVAIGEGAYLVKLSGRIETLNQELRGGAENAVSSAERAAWSRTLTDRVEQAPSRARGSEGGSPRLSPLVFQAPPPAPGNTAAVTLREALATVEGRQQLRGALDLMKEEDRQAKLLQKAPEWEEKEQKWKDRLLKNAPLLPEEQLKVGELFAKVNEGRRQVLDDMKAGLKTAGQADDEIDRLRDGAEKDVRTLLGDKRLKDLRDAEKRERDRDRGGGDRRRGERGPGQAPQVPGQPAPGQPAPG